MTLELKVKWENYIFIIVRINIITTIILTQINFTLLKMERYN